MNEFIFANCNNSCCSLHFTELFGMEMETTNKQAKQKQKPRAQRGKGAFPKSHSQGVTDLEL